MESVLSLPSHTFPELYNLSLKINWNKYSTGSSFFFSEALQKPTLEGKIYVLLSACLFFLWTTVWPMHCTGPWKRKPGIQYCWQFINSSITCGCRVFITTRQDNGWSSRKKKPSPMISLTSLFCHRLIQNSFQVTWTTLQSGNVLATTKGAIIWVLAVASPQYSRITVPAVPSNILLTGKKNYCL